jgi:hypothetical protein
VLEREAPEAEGAGVAAKEPVCGCQPAAVGFSSEFAPLQLGTGIRSNIKKKMRG